MFVCGTCRPANISFFSMSVSEGSSLSLCRQPVARQSLTLAFTGSIMPKKIILLLCWKDVLCLLWKAASASVRGGGGSQDTACVSAGGARGCGTARCSLRLGGPGVVESGSLDESHLEEPSKTLARAGPLQCFAALRAVGPWELEGLRFSEEWKLP